MRIAGAVVALVSLIGASILAGCTPVRTTAPGTVGVERKALLLVSSNEIMQGAKRSYDETISKASSQGRLNRNPAMLTRVRDVGSRLVPQAQVFRPDAATWDWEFNVIHENTVNAWCMPGGKIVFYSGIIDTLKLDDEEIAAIMGHEISHALREHGRERVSENLVANFGLNLASLSTRSSAAQSQHMAQAVQLGWLLPNSREHETEADRMGVELAARAGYDPRAAVRVWEKMKEKFGSDSSEFRSTHPSHERRIADLTVYSEKVYPLYQGARRP
jgi:predicted Zn-dependent protease